jgi:PAS domain S-box-containing protein
MARFDMLAPKAHPAILGYAIAIFCVVLSTCLSLLLAKFDITVTPHLIAIAVTVWYGGFGPGLLAIGLSILSLDYYFIAPIHHIEVGLTHIPYFVVFAVFALVISWLAESRRRAERWLESKVAERTAELRRTTSELRAILDSSPVGIALLGIDLTIQRCNPAFERIIGCTVNEIRGGEILPASSNRSQWKILTERLGRGESLPVTEIRLIRRDGTEFDAAIAFAPVHDEQGKAAALVGTVEDITDRKRVEEGLREAQTELERVNRVTTLGELTASLSHEIRQPITAAATNASTCLRWLNRDQPDIPEAREAASRVVSDVTRANDIISRIRQLFRKGELQREAVSVNEIIGDMVLLLDSEATKQSVNVRTELAVDLPKIMADRVQLQQVFMNLMLNGIDAMANTEGLRELTIKSQDSKNGDLLFSVTDTGVGLPHHKGDQIFNAFVTTKAHGTGMGLSISRSIIESHGGRLWAESNSGSGATFLFTLPTKVAIS